MRNSHGGFFVLGFMIPWLGVIAFLLLKFSAGHSIRFDEAAATVIATSLFYWLARLLAAWLVASNAGRPRRHELFTPLYDKRPHEWTMRLA